MICTGNPQIDAEFAKLNRNISDINLKIKSLEQYIAKSVSLHDLRLMQNEFTLKLNNINITTANTEAKLSLLTLPEDARFYLSESEVQEFKTNFSKLITMISDLETAYDNFVSTNMK